MNKFTAVIPFEWLLNPNKELIDNLPPRVLMLAHDLLAYDPDIVLPKLEELNRKIIIDNSASEKVPLDDNHLHAIITCAYGYYDEFCLPDVLEDGLATIGRSQTFLNDIIDRSWTEKYPFMFIPQGKTLSDFKQCISIFMGTSRNIPWIKSIGIPRNTVPRICKSRQILVDIVKEYIPEHIEIHLLGFTDNVADDLQVSRDIRVRSIDSAVPLRAHIYGAKLRNNRQEFIEELKKVGPRNDWFENPEISSTVIENLKVTNEIFN